MKETLNMRRQLAINLRYCNSVRRATQNMLVNRSLPAIGQGRNKLWVEAVCNHRIYLYIHKFSKLNANSKKGLIIRLIVLKKLLRHMFGYFLHMHLHATACNNSPHTIKYLLFLYSC